MSAPHEDGLLPSDSEDGDFMSEEVRAPVRSSGAKRKRGAKVGSRTAPPAGGLVLEDDDDDLDGGGTDEVSGGAVDVDGGAYSEGDSGEGSGGDDDVEDEKDEEVEEEVAEEKHGESEAEEEVREVGAEEKVGESDADEKDGESDEEVGDEDADDADASEADEPPAKRARSAGDVNTVPAAVPVARELKKAVAKKPVDDIWAMMNRPIAAKKCGGRGTGGRGVRRKDPAMDVFLGIAVKGSKGGLVRKKGPAVDKALACWLGGVKKSTPSKILRLDDVIAEAKEAEAKDAAATVVHKAGTGLEGVLGIVKGEKGPGVLDKTRDAWKGFKERDGKVADELDAYKKDKNRYTDKVSFLERTDHREWEADMARKKTTR